MVKTGQTILKTKKNKLVRTYFRTDEVGNLFQNPLIINSGKNAGRTTKEKIEVFPV